MPLVSRTFDQLIDFSRTSAATYVDATGKIVTTPASRNLLTYTQEFDNAAWNKATGGSVAANTTVAPDGTTTADSYTFGSSTTSFAYLSQAVTAVSTNPHTFSIWMKRPSGTGSRTIRLRISDVTTSTGASSNFTVTESWQRFEYTRASASSTGQVGVGFFEGSTGTPLAAGEVVEVWGAQLEAGSAATDYTRNVAGRFPPRFDYDPVTLAPKGLLIEEQRTNLLLRSEEVGTSPWTAGSITITANSTTAPDGTSTADTLTAAAGTNLSTFLNQDVSVSGTNTFSFYAKAGTHNFIQLMNTGDVQAFANFNISTGVVGTAGTKTTATITPAGNGWYRCVATFASTTAYSLNFRVYMVQAANSIFAAPWSPAGTETVFLWGAQLEAGAFATSYIPTAASQVTRTQDLPSIVAPNFAPWFNQAQGTIYVEFDVLAVGAGTSGMTIAKIGGASSNGYLFYKGLSANVFSGYADNNSAYLGDVSANTVAKSAIAYNGATSVGVLNGASVVTISTAGVASPDRLTLGFSTGAFQSGHLRIIRYYPTRLTNAQLQALTA